MTTYRSALDPFIVTGRDQVITDPRKAGPLEAAGLISAMHIAIDLACLELIEGRLEGLSAAPADCRTIRFAVNMGAPEDAYQPSIFHEGEIWTAACGYESKTIFWRRLHERLNPAVSSTISGLIEPAISRALGAGVEPLVLLAFGQTELTSNHQRMALHMAPQSARDMTASQQGDTP